MLSKRILIIGPESTGKSTLTEQLTQHYRERGYNVAGIQEFARKWIDEQLEGDMNRLDSQHITLFGTTQMSLVKDAARREDIVFSDTDAVTSLVFQRIYFDKVDAPLLDAANDEVWDLVLFTQPDVPWVDDGQRNLSHRREEICRLFQHELDVRQMDYLVVSGDWPERFHMAVRAVDALLLA